jgi:fructose-bisphosphate aldolase, class II
MLGAAMLGRICQDAAWRDQGEDQAMPVVSTKQLVTEAMAEGYAVPAINVVNDLTMEAVLAGAQELRSPMIVQTSVKTVRSIGLAVLKGMWDTMTAGIEVPVALHLDHCPDREVISACLAAGWSSVLFDAHELSVQENERQCIEVVAEARRVGADVEGEIEGIRGVEDDLGSEEQVPAQTLEVAVGFIERTGVDIFAPAIGNAHGMYTARPTLDQQRISDLVEATGIPMALHGGTGLSAEQFRDLIARGCAKVNVSTALKIAYMEANRSYLTENPTATDPPRLFGRVREAVMEMTREHIRMFGSEGRA